MFNISNLVAKNAGNIAKAAVGAAVVAATMLPSWAQGFGGTYQVTQRNVNGNLYSGTLYLDNSLRGQVVWSNHMQSAPFQASLNGNNLRFTLNYPGGLQGNYSAYFANGNSQLVNGNCWSNTGDSGTWVAGR